MKAAIYGYGNLGRGVESAIMQNPDIELFGVFTRRDPSSLKIRTDGARVLPASDVLNYKNDIDVMIICGGSATDLPEMTPEIARNFNCIDSFDTHALISDHFEKVDEAAKAGGNVALISAGWDPGMFSLMRLYGASVLPSGESYTFWGRGVSQGHSDAIRRIDGVLDARQYTVPVAAALDAVRNGEQPQLTTREKHTRECYVVAAPDADKARIEHEIVTMPNYFADYDTTVHFISREEMEREHSSLPHGGNVIRSGSTGIDGENSHTIEFSLKLDSNPEFTGSVIVAYARAVHRLSLRGESGARTVFDIAPAELSIHDGAYLREHLL